MKKSKKNDIDESVQKGLKFGVGMTYLATEALTKAMNKLEKEGKISKKESEKLVLDTLREYQTQANKYAKQLQKELDKLGKTNPDAAKKIAALNARIKERLNKPAKKRKK